MIEQVDVFLIPIVNPMEKPLGRYFPTTTKKEKSDNRNGKEYEKKNGGHMFFIIADVVVHHHPFLKNKSQTLKFLDFYIPKSCCHIQE